MDKYIGTKIIEGQASADAEGREPGYDLLYSDTGYRSWSPKGTFERHYRRTTEMTFGQAMEAARLGNKVRRAAWSSGSFAFVETYPDGPVRSQVFQRVLWEPRRQDYLYQPTQHDMAAEDWTIIEP